MMLKKKIQSINFDLKGDQLKDTIEKLYPFCRSITGNGVRKTLSVVSQKIPLEIHEVPSGTKAFDWEVPPEWNINDGWVKNLKGEKVIDFKTSNLHVLNYSIPVSKNVDLKELKEHVYTLPEHPDWVPYRTSYHNRTWGFCMAHKEYEELGEGVYEVMIDTSLKPGSLTYGEFFIKGELEEEILISTHVCHPSLCNDNLSGIVVTAELAATLSKIRTKYSYRFLFIPGTIGSIVWLSRNEDKIEKIKHGLVLNLLGDNSEFYYKKSRIADAEIDFVMQESIKSRKLENNIIDFYPYGYDERQFCSPGFNLPVGRLSRKPHGEFPEYHTSADNLDFIKGERLAESLEFILTVVEKLEQSIFYLNLNPKGEPQLGKRDLFKKIGGEYQTKDLQMALLWVLNLSDGRHSLDYISHQSKLDLEIIQDAAKQLEKVRLIRRIN